MKTFNTLRIVPTVSGYLAIEEPVQEVRFIAGHAVHWIDSWELPARLRDVLDTQPEEDNNATQ